MMSFVLPPFFLDIPDPDGGYHNQGNIPPTEPVVTEFVTEPLPTATETLQTLTEPAKAAPGTFGESANLNPLVVAAVVLAVIIAVTAILTIAKRQRA